MWFCSEYEGGPESGPFTPEDRAALDATARRPYWWRRAGVSRQVDCPHCDGTGRGPSSDGRTSCGFCL